MNKPEKQIIIDGKYCSPSELDPLKHTFIGTFRPAEAPCQDGSKTYGHYFWCDCGAMLSIRQDIRHHWSEGHMDYLQYKTIV